MRTLIADNRCVLLHGLASGLVAVLQPESVDALVTDPPAGIGFMGKAWDGDKGGRDAWVAWLAEQLAPSYAALKPGAYGLIWALPRTSHWTAYALEACGFEICDRVSHLFGTGFPKSLNIGKAIDKHLGVERPVTSTAERKATGRIEQGSGGFAFGEAWQLTSAGSPQAAEWEGWGTALKPACEDWWLVQKPFRGTYAENVLEHGVGGLNIDGCRIAYANDRDRQQAIVAQPDFTKVNAISTRLDAHARNGEMFDPKTGRWPAHLVLSHSPDCGDTCAEGCAVRLLDEQSGFSKSPGKVTRGGSRGLDFGMGRQTDVSCPADSGGASRFFYVAKGSRSEKDAGLDHLQARSGGEATDRVDGQAGLQNPRAGAGRTGGARNIHPTVKSVDLMRWLIRLITPPGGTVLDPFAGSGTTGVAALAEGMAFVGVEHGGETGEYLPIIEGRLRHALK